MWDILCISDSRCGIHRWFMGHLYFDPQTMYFKLHRNAENNIIIKKKQKKNFFDPQGYIEKYPTTKNLFLEQSV